MFFDLMRDKNRQMPPVANPLEVKSLRIWHCKYKTLDAIATFENLTSITIASFPDESLEVLASLKKLRDIRVLHLPKVCDLQPLSQLESLVSLSLETLPSWDASRKRTVIRSLEPLTQIETLKHLSLLGVVSSDLSLSQLERCESLVTGRFHGYPKHEIDRFFAATGIENALNPTFPV
jgi:hypothetical protein